ncbi:hypothetical protein ABID39_000704 [Bartonella japonica]|uniref:Uncharacterized protein n=1 Tax=Bartonella japonica TaxID=357761 RepID=A0ABV2FN69_9HYPH
MVLMNRLNARSVATQANIMMVPACYFISVKSIIISFKVPFHNNTQIQLVENLTINNRYLSVILKL